jgi:glycosyltransferase involved in cell wall biosynthesis
MRHLLICPEFPPAPGGGIGTYAATLARLLAERGEIVHVIALATSSTPALEFRHDDRLVIHRIRWSPQFRAPRDLLGLPFRPKPFVWEAGLLAESLVQAEQIDVVEAQEYQAPLYWFQVRRAMGLGPARKPPCVVHLHSPTELLARYNGWRPRESVSGTVRLERYTVRAADAVMAPSRALASWASSRYQRDVAVVPYPAAGTAPLARSRETWRSGTVCYVGRLEARKGIFEWTDAAVRAAQEFPEQRFEMVGADTSSDATRSVRRELEKRIPPEVRPRFRFAGAQPRGSLEPFLAAARVAVVPSRWDNYPYVCVEAMLSGLPVLGTRSAGISEMVRDGESGWLADSATPDELHARLRQALSTPPAALAAMGANASADIARVAGADQVVRQHLELRRSLSYRGLEASEAPPLPLPNRRSVSTRPDEAATGPLFE